MSLKSLLPSLLLISNRPFIARKIVQRTTIWLVTQLPLLQIPTVASVWNKWAQSVLKGGRNVLTCTASRVCALGSRRIHTNGSNAQLVVFSQRGSSFALDIFDRDLRKQKNSSLCFAVPNTSSKMKTIGVL